MYDISNVPWVDFDGKCIGEYTQKTLLETSQRVNFCPWKLVLGRAKKASGFGGTSPRPIFRGKLLAGYGSLGGDLDISEGFMMKFGWRPTRLWRKNVNILRFIPDAPWDGYMFTYISPKMFVHVSPNVGI